MKKIITYGTFDLLHDGHISILKRAKALGDYLIVAITADYFDIQRGKMNVSDSLIKRIDNVRSTGYADEIIIEEYEGQKITDIQKHEVDIFTVGSDWTGKFDYLKEYCDVVYLERTPDVSSTNLRNGQYGIVRLGIVGTGRIAWRAIYELKFVSGIEASAVYNPNEKSSNNFAKKYNISLSFCDYDRFLSEVNAVYIASPHATHFEYAKRALEAGKHVICEKPMVLKKEEAVLLFELAAKKGLVLMEAVKTAYAPGFDRLLSIAKSNRIGRIVDVEATFTKLVEPGGREYDPAYGGAFTELASYTLLPIIKLLGKDYENVYFDFFKDENAVDIYAKCYFKYPNAIATAKVGIGVKSEGQLLVSGTKGYILVKSPWWLTKSFEVCYENPEDNEHFSASFDSYGLRYEFSDFVGHIRNSHIGNYKLSKGDSIELANIMEIFLKERN